MVAVSAQQDNRMDSLSIPSLRIPADSVLQLLPVDSLLSDSIPADTLATDTVPKKKKDTGISMSVKDENLRATLSCRTKPESIVKFLEEIASWMPEYKMIEEKWKEEQKKKELASDIAFDLLKRFAEEKLESKGYSFTVENTRYQYRARIRISIPKGIEITFMISLLEDFYEELSQIVNSLPSRI